VFTSWPQPDLYRHGRIADYASTERSLPGSGLRWTVLRQTYGLDQVLARDVRDATATGALTAPAGDARTTPAACEDLAEATANVLTSAGHVDVTYELSGPDAIGWTDLAELASSLTGKEIPYEPLTDAEFRKASVDGGFPEDLADELIEVYEAFRGGWTGTPTGDLATLLGRPPTGSLEAVRRIVEPAA
jgi:NAD(P)H dehydrogenase (quinone)